MRYNSASKEALHFVECCLTGSFADLPRAEDRVDEYRGLEGSSQPAETGVASLNDVSSYRDGACINRTCRKMQFSLQLRRYHLELELPLRIWIIDAAHDGRPSRNHNRTAIDLHLPE